MFILMIKPSCPNNAHKKLIRCLVNTDTDKLQAFCIPQFDNQFAQKVNIAVKETLPASSWIRSLKKKNCFGSSLKGVVKAVDH